MARKKTVTDQQPDNIPSGFIKAVALELSDYKFEHSPLNDDSKTYLGREKQHAYFLSILSQRNKKGVYLVTGYRGMGKTSFINKTLDKYKKQTKAIVEKININITQSNVNEIDILRQVTSQLKEKITHNSYSNILIKRCRFLRKMFFYLFAGMLLITWLQIKELYTFPASFSSVIKLVYSLQPWLLGLITALFLGDVFHTFGNKFDLIGRTSRALNEFITSRWNTRFRIWNYVSRRFYWVAAAVILLVLAYFGYMQALTDWFFKTLLHLPESNMAYLLFWLTCFLLTDIFLFVLRTVETPYSKIQTLYERAFASVLEEATQEYELSVIGKVASRFISGNEKRVANYPIATSKELEEELILTLDLVNKRMNSLIRSGYARKLEFFFIFDELDKVDIAMDSSHYYEELDTSKNRIHKSNYFDENRERKQMIVSILAGLKSFLTRANGRFIFIAGREMFDGAMADIADRQASLSSLFNHIFYLDSFSKEDDQSQAGIRSIVEELLRLVLLPESKKEKNSEYAGFLQTYISSIGNGTTFELVDAPGWEDAAKAKILIILQQFITYLIYRSNGSPKKLRKILEEFILPSESITEKSPRRIVMVNLVEKKKKRLYLYFGYRMQYKISFINYLFRPYNLYNSRYIKHFSDNILVSTTYLMDHLIKFHPFAFSINNLELIPEVLSSNKTPGLRQYIQTMVSYLSKNHLRETEVGLFEYKFYSKIYNELSYISKTFEEESAAFNFTLDESYLVKQYIRRKIKELRSIYKEFNKTENQIFSIAYLNGLLGDMHFFDQEYDDAIVAYSDAIKPINSNECEKLNSRDFLTLIRFNLKLGLCFEKTKSYEDAMGFYSDVVQDSLKYLKNKPPKAKGNNNNYYYTNQHAVTDDRVVFSELGQVLNQGFIAEAYIQEKMGIASLSVNKLLINIESFKKMVDKLHDITNDNNHILWVNYCLSIGNLMYYKNVCYRANENQHGIADVIDPEKKYLNSFREFVDLPHLNFEERNVEALCYYVASLRFLHLHILDLEKADISFRQIFDIYSDLRQVKPYPDKYVFKNLATAFSNIGNCLLAKLSLAEINELHDGLAGKNSKHIKILDEILNNVFSENPIDKLPVSKFPRQLFLVFLFFRLAGEYYEKADKPVSKSLQLRKILYAVRMVIGKICGTRINIPPADAERFSTTLGSKIVKPVLIITSENSLLSDRPQVDMYLDICRGMLPGGVDNYFRNNVSTNPEVREMLTLYGYIKLQMNLIGVHERKLINPYMMVSTQFTRMGELHFKAKLCKELLRPLSRNNQPPDNDLVVDLVYCLYSIIAICSVYNPDLLLHYSFLGDVHKSLGNAMEKYKTELTPGHNCYNRLDDLLKFHGTITINANYHFHMAKRYYEKTISMHQQGDEYKKLVKDMLYLEDAFNDNVQHFGIALERCQIVSRIIDFKLSQVIPKVEDDAQFAHEHFNMDAIIN